MNYQDKEKLMEYARLILKSAEIPQSPSVSTLDRADNLIIFASEFASIAQAVKIFKHMKQNYNYSGPKIYLVDDFVDRTLPAWQFKRVCRRLLREIKSFTDFDGEAELVWPLFWRDFILEKAKSAAMQNVIGKLKSGQKNLLIIPAKKFYMIKDLPKAGGIINYRYNYKDFQCYVYEDTEMLKDLNSVAFWEYMSDVYLLAESKLMHSRQPAFYLDFINIWLKLSTPSKFKFWWHYAG